MLCGAGDLSPQYAREQLGRRLFYDADLSADGSMSCATCHEQRHAFADGNATHPGVTDEAGVRNVPSLGNVGDFVTLTWVDQHISRLEKQFFVPVMGHHPVEMGMTDRKTMTNRIEGDACYRRLFARSFPHAERPIDAETIAMAVAAFERTLVSRNSQWDEARRGKAVLSAEAKRGEAQFLGRGGCSGCHAAPLFTDQKFYAFDPAANVRIRTPSLRNVGVTAPYWHDGSAKTLHEALAAHRGTRSLSENDEKAVEAFLLTLTDEQFLHDAALGLPPEACPP
ncbi:cytochrome C peroxidase [Acetobacter sp. LMG 1627]|uniref:Cytochrome C peroxidase n=1 Tax=Acetobacter conturbans TaxID=1737472 RepID=A0ABX0JXZ0_9PROT|nr:cytochrome C peroxidase [Acetobacter conturbans]